MDAPADLDDGGEDDDRDRTRRRHRRWLVLAGGLFALIGVLGTGVWFWWLRGFRPSLHPGERLGIDVSSHQGLIDWRHVRHNGITFAYVKATEGSDFVDDHFLVNWIGAAAAGLDRGAYHFFTLCASGEAQATNFLRTVPTGSTALPPAIDLELAGNCASRPAESSVFEEVEHS